MVDAVRGSSRDVLIFNNSPIPEVLPGDRPRPLEEHLRSRWRPVAVVGVVENGVIRLLDDQVKLPEQARVIVVASDPG